MNEKLIVELPCSVGDTVWCLTEEFKGIVIDCIEVYGFKFNSQNEVVAVINVFGEEIPLPIYKTYGEARKALERTEKMTSEELIKLQAKIEVLEALKYGRGRAIKSYGGEWVKVVHLEDIDEMIANLKGETE